MEKRIRLRRNQDFKKVYARGKPVRNRSFVLIVKNNGLDHPRVGFSITKKMGNAVTRNRLKRRLREIVRLYRHKLGRPIDIVVIPKQNTLELDYKKLESQLHHALKLAVSGKKVSK